jgi:signal transduction histidine kinase
MLEIALYCAEFIISQVGNFLDISKLEHSELILCPTPTEIVNIVRKIICMHRFKAETKSIYMKLNAADNIPELSLIDNARFTQVLVNLISNAIKFTEDGGITVNIYFSDKETINNDEHSKSSLLLNHQNKSSEYSS